METHHTSPTHPVPTPRHRLVVAALLRTIPLLIVGSLLIATNTSLLWLNLAVIGVDLMTILALSHLMKAEGRTFTDLFTPLMGSDILWGLLFGAVIIVTWFPAAFIGNLVAYQGPPPAISVSASIPLWLGITSLVVMPATIAVAEEALYRGYLQNRLSTAYGQGFALLTTATVFSIQHVGFALGDMRSVVAKVVTTFIAGLIFGALMAWKKKVTPLVIGHCLLDVFFLGLPIFLISLP